MQNKRKRANAAVFPLFLIPQSAIENPQSKIRNPQSAIRRRWPVHPLFLGLVLLLFCNAIKLGSDRLYEKKYFEWIKGKRVGLITNATGVDSQLRLTADRLRTETGIELVALFAPEHGLSGAAQAGDSVTSTATVYSLYGDTPGPTPEMLQNVDVLVFDIQDVGVRFYTYLSTLFESMKSAARDHKPFIVLDRPNPVTGRRTAGPILEPGYESFVGIFKMPIRYGMTVGELASLMNTEAAIGCDLKVVPLKGWKRSRWYDETKLQWVLPSPNIPTVETAVVYPGLCLIEGTNLSEGRGTTKPFELVGAPWLDSVRLARSLNNLGLKGVYFRPQAFTPTFSKHKGEVCQGIQVHVLDRDEFEPLAAVLHLCALIMRQHPAEFQFLESHFDRLAGSCRVREELLRGDSADEIARGWAPDLKAFDTVRKKHLLYR